MSYRLTDVDDRAIFPAPIKSYDCTSESDISKLPKFGIPGTQVLDDGFDEINNAPCGFGSTALLVTGTVTQVHRLMPDNDWKKM